MACSMVMTLRICASGFNAPLAWFFTATAARCSRVVPNWYMWRRAIIANREANVEPALISPAQSPAPARIARNSTPSSEILRSLASEKT